MFDPFGPVEHVFASRMFYTKIDEDIKTELGEDGDRSARALNGVLHETCWLFIKPSPAAFLLQKYLNGVMRW